MSQAAPLEQKAALRAAADQAVRRLNPEQRAEASANACALLKLQPVWERARSILFYSPFRQELDVWQLLTDALDSRRLVALPRFAPERQIYEAARVNNLDRDIQAARFGIREPTPTCSVVPLNELDLALVPGVAYDRNGARLGRGYGYYDRFLAAFPGIKCGVAFAEQVLEAIPMEAHDVRLDCILTPTLWIQCHSPV